jgi:hypothetical protein
MRYTDLFLRLPHFIPYRCGVGHYLLLHRLFFYNHEPVIVASLGFEGFLWGRTESAGKSRQRVKGESPYIVMASDQL